MNIGTLLKYPLNLLKEKNSSGIQKFKIESFGEEIIPNFSNTCNFDLINKQISSICLVDGSYESRRVCGTGFFCKIPYKNAKIPVLITSYQMINDEFLEKNKELKIYRNFKEYNIKIDKKNKIYSSPSDFEHYDIMIIKLNEEYIMIIKLNEEDNINEYLELDEKIFNNDSEIYNKTKYVYMLSFSDNAKPKISFGDLLKEKSHDFKIKYNCVSGDGSGGAPILDYYSNKVIGIHIGAMKEWSSKKSDYKFGTFLKYPLEELNKKNWFYNSKKNNKWLTHNYSEKNIKV